MTHHNWSNYNKETKRCVSLQVEEKTPRVGERKKKEVLSFSQLLSVASVQRRLSWWNRGFTCKPLRHQQSPAEPWGRSQVKLTTGEQEKKKKKRCLPGLENFTKACLFYVNPQWDFFLFKKKKGCSKYVAILCSQYCHGTLTALLLPDDIKTLITHFDQSDWEMTPDHIWWRMFHGMERRHLFFFFSPIINSLISLLDGRLHQLSSAVGHLLILISCSVAPLNKQKGFNFKLQCKQGFCKFLSTCHKQGSHKS